MSIEQRTIESFNDNKEGIRKFLYEGGEIMFPKSKDGSQSLSLFMFDFGAGTDKEVKELKKRRDNGK